MSLDYSYTLGYGFFIDRADLSNAGVEEESSLYEDTYKFLQEFAAGDLLEVATASSSMDSGPEKVLIAVKRSLVCGDAKYPSHSYQEPAEYEDLSDFAYYDELHALDVFASLCNAADSVTPKIRFYITIS